MRVVAQNGLTVSQYEREIARLSSQVTRLEEQVKSWKALNEDNIVLGELNAIELERWINVNLVPQMHTQYGANGSLMNLSSLKTWGT